jgi:hypothetical protein
MSDRNATTTRMQKPLIAIFVVGYLLLAGAVVYGMVLVRSYVISSESTPEAQADWNQWRAEAAQQDGTHGPVQRSMPKSPEPPLLVLLRDYFAACVAGLLLPLTGLYFITAWLTGGVIRQSRNATSHNEVDHVPAREAE